jgi:hypothetical protein
MRVGMQNRRASGKYFFRYPIRIVYIKRGWFYILAAQPDINMFDTRLFSFIVIKSQLKFPERKEGTKEYDTHTSCSLTHTRFEKIMPFLLYLITHICNK